MATKKQKKATCPVCDKPSVERFRPFCSSRCADVDLHRWLGGIYAIPSEDKPANDDGDEV